MPQAAHFNLVGSPVALNPEPFETLALLRVVPACTVCLVGMFFLMLRVLHVMLHM